MKNKIEDMLEKLITQLDENIFNADISSIQNIFSVGEFKYSISITPAKNIPGGVVGSFRLLNNPNKPEYEGGDLVKYYKDLEDAEMGDADIREGFIRAVSIVATFFKKYIEQNQPPVFIYHARNDKRARHYKLFGEKLAKLLSYHLTSQKNDVTGITEFRLYKNKDDIRGQINEHWSMEDYPYIRNYQT